MINKPLTVHRAMHNTLIYAIFYCIFPQINDAQFFACWKWVCQPIHYYSNQCAPNVLKCSKTHWEWYAPKNWTKDSSWRDHSTLQNIRLKLNVIWCVTYSAFARKSVIFSVIFSIGLCDASKNFKLSSGALNQSKVLYFEFETSRSRIFLWNFVEFSTSSLSHPWKFSFSTDNGSMDGGDAEQFCGNHNIFQRFRCCIIHLTHQIIPVCSAI